MTECKPLRYSSIPVNNKQVKHIWRADGNQVLLAAGGDEITSVQITSAVPVCINLSSVTSHNMLTNQVFMPR